MVTLDNIVKDLLSQEGKNTTHEYLRYLNIANKGLKELTFDILGATKVTLLLVDAALRIDLPGDFTDYTFVGLVTSNGRLTPLGFKNNIPGVGTDNVITPKTEVQSYLDDGIIGKGGIYGLGGGQNTNGYYSPKLDLDNWQMIFTSIAAGKYIYMEYISDGRAEGGQSIIHPYAEAALSAYIWWKIVQRKRGTSNIVREEARRDYYNEKRLARARLSSFTKEEALQTIRKGFKQSVKL
jgi:hypothetical protein